MSDTEPKLLPSVISIISVLEKLDELKNEYQVLVNLNNEMLLEFGMTGHPGELGAQVFRMFYRKTNTLCQFISLMGWLNPEEYTNMNFPQAHQVDPLITEVKELVNLMNEVMEEYDEIPKDMEVRFKEKYQNVESLQYSLIMDPVEKVTDKLEDMFGDHFH